MPTFGLDDGEDQCSQESFKNKSRFRDWLFGSMQYFRGIKFTRKNVMAVERQKKEQQEEAKAKAEAYKKFETQRQQHYAQFKSKSKEAVSCKVQEQENIQGLSQSWLEEYNHPSSTANVSIHEVLGEGNVITEVHKAKVNNTTLDTTSTFDLSSTFDSTAKSIFSTSVLTGNAPSDDKNSQQKFPMDKLDAYTGARPSFGGSTVTSTPMGKILAPPRPTSISPQNIIQPQHTQKPVSLFGQPTPTKTDATPAKEPLNTIPEASESQGSNNTGSPVKVIRAPTPNKVETPIGQKKFFNNLVMYYSQDLDKKEDNDIAKERFEKSGDTSLRSTIKRTVNDKLGICSKKHATAQELKPVINFLSDLMSGKIVDSHNGQKLKVEEEGAVAYTYDAIISYCMGIMDRDNDLVHVLATILRGISLKNRTFESVLLGQLFTSSTLLTLDPQICTKFAETVVANSSRKTSMFMKEKGIIKLYMALHLNNQDENSETSRLNMKHLWRAMAVILNAPLCIISTVLLSTSFVEICSDRMRKAYPTQWPKIIKVLLEQLLPLLEKNLQSSSLAQSAGEAAFISVLSNALENL